MLRGFYPLIGIDIVLKRRNKEKKAHLWTIGPGNMAQALAISLKENGHDLSKQPLWLEDRGFNPQQKDIEYLPRVGIEYAEEWALQLWRFRLKNTCCDLLANNAI